MERDNQLAKIIWDYQLMHHKLEKADLILVLGSHDVRVADYAAELYLAGWAPLLVFSGGFGRLTKDWQKPEAEIFAEAAIRMGVPKEKILLENKSTNTGENIVFTKTLLENKGVNPKRVILVQKPYMERRSYATFKKYIPEVEVIVTSPQIPFEKYDLEDRPKDQKIHVLVGDMQRIKIYAEKGFIVPQEIPKEVWDAFEKLVKLGYTKHLVKE
ncbi:TPA: hypothetical protein DCQ44_01655 [Candidatus Taylorbacteria bacterium]|nr:hypothetical protein [Candidatus Taylorbacteria bacterium]